jgi:hypothetical protein
MERYNRAVKWYLLFLVHGVILWPPFYNKVEPAWSGIPFFYWFQLLWIVVGVAITAIVYWASDD